MAELMGICDICCTPPATTTSIVPDITAWAAKWTGRLPAAPLAGDARARRARVAPAQAPAAASHRAADCVDDVGLGHGGSFPQMPIAVATRLRWWAASP